MPTSLRCEVFAVCALGVLIQACSNPSSTKKQRRGYQSGDEIVVKATASGQALGERGVYIEEVIKGASAWAVCQFGGKHRFELRFDQIARVGAKALGEWRVGDRVVAGVHHRSQGELLLPGHAGVVVGAHNRERVLVAFESMPSQLVAAKPNEIHMKMSAKPRELLCAVIVGGAVLCVAAWLMRKWDGLGIGVLPGGYKLEDKIVSLHHEDRCGITIGSLGFVAGDSPVDRKERVRCSFRPGVSVNMHFSQIAKCGVPVDGGFKTGDRVVGYFPDAFETTLSNGQKLCHGTPGRVIGKATDSSGKIRVVFFSDVGTVTVSPGEITDARAFRRETARQREVARRVAKAQREEQRSALDGLTGAEPQGEGRVPDAFQCPQCFDLLHEPARLACGHVLCKGCIEQWQFERAKSGAIFTSPCCNQMIPFEYVLLMKMARTIETSFPAAVAVRRAADSVEGDLLDPDSEAVRES